MFGGYALARENSRTATCGVINDLLCVMHSILILTSTYPRWQNDTEPPFVHLLCKELSRDYRIIVLAPHFPMARTHEVMDHIIIHRFRYFISSKELLAYNGGIIQSLKRNRLKYFLIPFFVVSQFVNTLLLCKKYDIDLIHAHWIIPQAYWRYLPEPLQPGNQQTLHLAWWRFILFKRQFST